MAENTEDLESTKRKLFIFNTDVSEIPCFRDSMINGIGTGIAAGLGYFMYSSKTRLSTHVAFGTFWCSTLAYWFTCRYKFSHTKFNVQQLKEGVKIQNLMSGTEQDLQFRSEQAGKE